MCRNVGWKREGSVCTNHSEAGIRCVEEQRRLTYKSMSSRISGLCSVQCLSITEEYERGICKRTENIIPAVLWKCFSKLNSGEKMKKVGERESI
jgi:hypothetical protein